MFSFLARKKRKGGLSISFGETVIYKQEYVTILPGSKRSSRNNSHTILSRIMSNPRRSHSGGMYTAGNAINKKPPKKRPEVSYKILDTLAPSPDISQITFSVNKVKQNKLQQLDVPSELLSTLNPTSGIVKKKKPERRLRTQRSRVGYSDSLFKPTSKPVKKVRFADEVTIHRVSVYKFSPVPYPETFKLIITLQCIWGVLDEDKDGYLNLKELQYFANEVWEDEDVEKMLKAYSKEPEKGLDFDDWCNLIKEEDPELSELVDDLYVLFVEGSDDSEEDTDEKSKD